MKLERQTVARLPELCPWRLIEPALACSRQNSFLFHKGWVFGYSLSDSDPSLIYTMLTLQSDRFIITVVGVK